MEFSQLVSGSSAGERHDMLLELSGRDSGHAQVRKATAELSPDDRERLRMALASAGSNSATPRGAFVESLSALPDRDWEDLAQALATGKTQNHALARAIANISQGQRLDLEAELVRRGHMVTGHSRNGSTAGNGTPLVCPDCGGALAPFERVFGYVCQNCEWLLPTVQSIAAEDVRIEHVTVGLLKRGSKVRVTLSWSGEPLAEMTEEAWKTIQSASLPVRLGRDMPSAALAGLGPDDVWWHSGLLWSTKELDLSPEVVAIAAAGWSDWERRQQQALHRHADEDALIAAAEAMAKEERRKARLAWADAKLSGESARRQPIPRTIRYEVFTRDQGRCVECGSQFELQFDHIIPVAMGGATSVDNLQLLCSDCNRRKGATLG